MNDIKINDEGELLCPDCGGQFLHLELVMVRARREDCPATDVVVQARTGEYRVINQLPVTRRRAKPNGLYDEYTVGAFGIVPDVIHCSGRRDHTILRFSCEFCEGTKEIRFEQHKGVTYSGWTR